MTKSDIRDKQICLCRRLQPRFVLGSFGVVLMSDQVFLQVLLSAACQFAVLLQFMSNLMYREDHTTDCWINLLRLPIITIVTSSLYNIIFFCATHLEQRVENQKTCNVKVYDTNVEISLFSGFLFARLLQHCFFPRSFYLFLYLKK